MVASKGIQKGQEIFNDYGQRPRSDLLRRYGYITDNAKIWDIVELDNVEVIRIASEHHDLNENEKDERVISATLDTAESIANTRCSFNWSKTGMYWKSDMICVVNHIVRSSNFPQL